MKTGSQINLTCHNNLLGKYLVAFILFSVLNTLLLGFSGALFFFNMNLAFFKFSVFFSS